MKIKIIKSSKPTYWYAPMVGQIVEAKLKRNDKRYKLSNYPNHLIEQQDAEVIKPTKNTQFNRTLLKTGMRVETAKGIIYIVILKAYIGGKYRDIITRDSWYYELRKDYNYDLTVNKSYKPTEDIVKIYEVPMNPGSFFDLSVSTQLLYSRNRIMTQEEIEEELGYKIEIKNKAKS